MTAGIARTLYIMPWYVDDSRDTRARVVPSSLLRKSERPLTNDVSGRCGSVRACMSISRSTCSGELFGVIVNLGGAIPAQQSQRSEGDLAATFGAGGLMITNFKFKGEHRAAQTDRRRMWDRNLRPVRLGCVSPSCGFPESPRCEEGNPPRAITR
jgi:hypothetical protein